MPRPASAFGVSIDEILETAQAHPNSEELPHDHSNPEQTYPHQHLYATPLIAYANRPEPARHPSRIGGTKPVDRPITPGIQAMKKPITVEYSSPGLKPPVYIFTDLSDPQWEAVEMDVMGDDHGAYQFKKGFQVEPGEYQYKFRLGPGEWWALDSSKPSVDDGLGNRNNSIQVVAMAHPAVSNQFSDQTQHGQVAAHEEERDHAPLIKHTMPEDQHLANEAVTNVQPRPFEQGMVSSHEHTQAPLMKHEMQEEQQRTTVAAVDLETKSPERKIVDPQSVSDKSSGAPLMKHESASQERSKALVNNEISPELDTHPRAHEDASPLLQHEVASAQTSNNVPAITNDVFDDNQAGDDDSEDEGPPLLSHERTTSSSTEQNHSPLMRNESHQSGDQSISRISSLSHLDTPTEHDVAGHLFPINVDDPNLERFPTDEKGILEHIRRTSMNLPKDETTAECLSPVSTKNLPSVIEEDDHDDDATELEQVRDTGEQEASLKVGTKNINPVKISSDDNRPTNPMTPPMTPKELEDEVEELEKEENVAQDVQEIDEEETEEQKELVEMEAIAERSWLQKALDVVAHPITWVAIVGLAFAYTAGYPKFYTGDVVHVRSA